MKIIPKKFLTLIITLFLVSLLAFLAFQIIPGDPTTKLLGTQATPEAVAALRHEMGLDAPVFVRYFRWLGAFVTGDFGTSYSYHMPVAEMLGEKLAITGTLVLLCFFFTAVVSIPLGIWAGSLRSRTADCLHTAGNQIVMSIPSFLLGILAIFLFGNLLHWFVPGAFVSYRQNWGSFLAYLLLPAASIAIPRIAMTVKMLRTCVQQELTKGYVRTARSRGLSPAAILWGQVLKNTWVPTITFFAVSAAEIMTGTILIEQVFTIPGVGRLLLASIGNRDFPVVQAIVVLMAAWIVLVHFLADLLCRCIDPRLRGKERVE